jgi:hypothetical protein
LNNDANDLRMSDHVSLEHGLIKQAVFVQAVPFARRQMAPPVCEERFCFIYTIFIRQSEFHQFRDAAHISDSGYEIGKG